MKRILQLISFSIIAILLTAPIASGQEENVEKKVEKRIKIVTVDKDGNKVVLDTTITDDTDLSEIYPEFFKENNVKIMSKDKINKWKSEDGSIYIMKSGDGESFSFYSDDKGNIGKEKNVHIIKKGDGETFSIVKVGEGDEDELHTKHKKGEEKVLKEVQKKKVVKKKKK